MCGGPSITEPRDLFTRCSSAKPVLPSLATSPRGSVEQLDTPTERQAAPGALGTVLSCFSTSNRAATAPHKARDRRATCRVFSSLVTSTGL